MRVLCVGCLVHLAAGVRRIQDALTNHIFTELQTAAEHDQDDASPTEPSLRYEERRVYRDDGRAIGEVSLVARNAKCSRCEPIATRSRGGGESGAVVACIYWDGRRMASSWWSAH